MTCFVYIEVLGIDTNDMFCLYRGIDTNDMFCLAVFRIQRAIVTDVGEDAHA